MDPRAAIFDFKAYEMGVDADTREYTSFTERRSPRTPARKKSLASKGNSSAFLPIFKESISNVRLYRKKFRCNDPADMYIYGSYDS